jgi:hypothetical protein
MSEPGPGTDISPLRKHACTLRCERDSIAAGTGASSATTRGDNLTVPHARTRSGCVVVGDAGVPDSVAECP